MTFLSSIHNEQIKAWKELNKSRAARLESGTFLAEGEHMAGEALKEKAALKLLIREGAEEKYSAYIGQAEAQQLPVYILSEAAFAAISDAKTPQGITAVCGMDKLRQHFDTGIVVALDDVQDPGNVGTILRTMDAVGFDRVIMTRESADAYAPKTLRASMGAVFRVPVELTDDLPGRLNALSASGYTVLAGALNGEPFYERSPEKGPVCLIIGNEGNGISEAVMRCATRKVKLPMRGGAESLNAAVACAVMLYDILRYK